MSIYDPGPRNEDGEPIDPYYEDKIKIKEYNPVISFIATAVAIMWAGALICGTSYLIDYFIKK